MATGPLKDNNRHDDKVNLRKSDTVRDLDDLLADAEYQASLSEKNEEGKTPDAKSPKK